MGSRLVGIVATLWFFFAAMVLFVATTLSPMGLRVLLPEGNPATWIMPVLLVGVPVALVGQRFAPPAIAKPILWIGFAALTVLALGLFAFLAATFFGH